MISQNISKSCGIIYRIRNNLDIKSKRLIYYSLTHKYLTDCVNVWSSRYRTNLKKLCTAQKRSVRALYICDRTATTFQGYFLKSKNSPS